ncbi:MAG TPA: SDR family NAD(P)-dependent oxidoreductase, partial [Dehalococcoidia bacterium]|nr:SDR family NAD(P)-dependent oxidoreductase [Dehalococcoidia bacterium]
MSCAIDGRVAVVTGSSRGLGRAIALELASHGSKVVINYLHSRQEAERLRDEIRDRAGEAICLQANVAEEAEAKRLIDTAVQEFGGIDILVNNAGINRERLLRMMKSEDWHDVLRTNLDSVFYCTHAAARHMMKQRRGHIVNIASTVGQMGNIG